MHFEIVGEISEIEIIATGHGIRRLKVLQKRYGGRHWRKQQGVATIRLPGAQFGEPKCTGMKLTRLGASSWLYRAT